MQPTQQSVIPWLFYRADQATGSHSVVIPTGFDGVVTGLDISLAGATSAAEVILTDTSGARFAALGLGTSRPDGASYASQLLWEIIPDGAGLVCVVLGSTAYVSVSGYLVTPNAASLMPV
jgi:hypothetical protein